MRYPSDLAMSQTFSRPGDTVADTLLSGLQVKRDAPAFAGDRKKTFVQVLSAP